ILTIKDIGPDQYGTYRCTAVNDNGVHFADIIVKEGESPPHSNSVILTEGSGFHSDDDGDDDPSDSADSGGTDAEMRKRERSNLASTTTAPIVYHFTTMHFHSGELVPQQVSSLSGNALIMKPFQLLKKNSNY
uniref:Immunoglobulin I-set domain-containing protein n=1 Tax=Parascaris univalens TaxID=6257 RepID=A0A915AEZ2_PARUN